MYIYFSLELLNTYTFQALRKKDYAPCIFYNQEHSSCDFINKLTVLHVVKIEHMWFGGVYIYIYIEWKLFISSQFFFQIFNINKYTKFKDHWANLNNSFLTHINNFLFVKYMPYLN